MAGVAIAILITTIFAVFRESDSSTGIVEESAPNALPRSNSTAAVSGTVPAAIAGHQFVPGEILVRFDSNATDREVAHAIASVQGSIKRTLDESPKLVLVSLPDSLAVADAKALLQASNAVEISEPNFVYKTNQVANDPAFIRQWGLNNTGQLGGAPDIDINAPEAWQQITGSHDIVIGVIDTGVSYVHRDLEANVWRNPGEIPSNGLDDDQNGYVDDVYGIDTLNSDADPLDDHGHGTHVAGIIGATGNNGIDTTGVMWSVSIVACKFLSRQGYGNLADAIECLDYFLDLKRAGINVVATNNSWGGGAFSQVLQDKIAEHEQEDILFIAAAGNDKFDNDQIAHYPSSYDNANIIAVAAMDETGQLARFSNWGATSVDIAAPGDGILSLFRNHATGLQDGTSMAAPFVTGVAGLLKANDPRLDGASIKRHILLTGTRVPEFSSRMLSGMRLRAVLPVIDIDADGMPDRWEEANGLNPANPFDAGLDGDGDGATNLEEFENLTDPNNPDTDADGLLDGDEISLYGSDPLLSDTDGDGIDDGDEINQFGTDPTLADSDGDSVGDGSEINEHGTDPLLSDTDGDGAWTTVGSSRTVSTQTRPEMMYRIQTATD